MRFKPLSRWDRLDAAQARRLQVKRLRDYLSRRVLPFSPFYAKRFRELGIDVASLRTFDDLRRLPFTTKLDITPSEQNPDGPRSFVLQPTPEMIRTRLPKPELLKLLTRKLFLGEKRLRDAMMREFNPVSMLFTTGRSASSLPFFLSQFDLDILRTTGKRICDVLEMRPSKDKVVSLFPYAPHLAFWQVSECGAAGGVLTLSTGGGRVMGSERILGIFSRLKPTVICGMPGYFYHILRRAREAGTDLSYVEKVALGGESVPTALKVKIIALLSEMGATDPKVVSVYGFTEARQCWAECAGAADTGFHTSADLGLFEIVDPDTGEPVPDGTTGEIVYTTLEGRGSAVLRYRTGDIAEGGMTHEPCPGCGRQLPRVSSRIRRVSNVKTLDLSKVKGTLVNLNSVTELLNGHPEIEEWQIVIRKANDDPHEVDEMMLHVALTAGVDDGEFRSRIQRELVALTEVRFNDVLFGTVPELLERVGMDVNMKEERIVDLRRKIAVSDVGVSRG